MYRASFAGTSVLRRFFAVIAVGLLGMACATYAAECAPPEAIEAFESGQAHLQSGRFGKAISEMERAVAIYPDFQDAWYALYESYRRVDRLDDAIEALEQLVRIEGFASYGYLLALHRAEASVPSAARNALYRCRQLKAGSKRAIAACEKAVAIHPDYADARYFLGVNYIYADDKESAKEQLAALVMLEPIQAGMLVDAMSVITDWLTDEYQQELKIMFEAAPAPSDPVAAAKVEHEEFTDQEVSRILKAYEKQILTLQKLMTDPTLLPEACEFVAPTEFRDKLEVEVASLSFVRIEVSPDRPDCQHQMGYELLDVRDIEDRQRGLSEVVKTARILGVGDPARERWRVGLNQEWRAEQYCKAECSSMLEFRIDMQVNNALTKFRAWLEILEDVVDIGRCVNSNYGEIQEPEEW